MSWFVWVLVAIAIILTLFVGVVIYDYLKNNPGKKREQ